MGPLGEYLALEMAAMAKKHKKEMANAKQLANVEKALLLEALRDMEGQKADMVHLYNNLAVTSNLDRNELWQLKQQRIRREFRLRNAVLMMRALNRKVGFMKRRMREHSLDVPGMREIPRTFYESLANSDEELETEEELEQLE